MGKTFGAPQLSVCELKEEVQTYPEQCIFSHFGTILLIVALTGKLPVLERGFEDICHYLNICFVDTATRPGAHSVPFSRSLHFN
jgi:hypothetical protein